MKITPMAQGQHANVQGGSGQTASPLKMSIAKAIAAGQPPPQVPPESPRENWGRQDDRDVKRIKMQTNFTTSRDVMDSMPQEIPAEAAQSDGNDTAASGEVKPLSPQLAAIARQRRALQVKEKELADREKALSERPQGGGSEDIIARLKSQPLSVLQEHGVTYDQLTEAILASNQNAPDLNQFKEDLRSSIKQDLDKSFQEREAQQEEQVLSDIRREAERRARVGDDFELIAKTNSYDDVVDLIKRVYKRDNEVLLVEEAMQLVEEDLINEALKVTGFKKIQSRLQPQYSPQQLARPAMRTLTSRDGQVAPMTARRQRALAAFHGTLKK